jgi:hypothetical protein
MVDSRPMPDPSPNRGVMITLAYLWPLALVPLVVEKDDAEVQWHAKHGLVLMAAEVVVLIAFSLVASFLSAATFGLGCAFGIAFGMLTVLLWVAILLVHMIAIVKGIGGSRLIVPWVSEYANRF